MGLMGGVLPGPVSPMLATVGSVPEGAGWAFEFKWDGVRAVVGVGGGEVRAMSRNDRDVTGSYPELLGLRDLVSRPVLLDGELVALDGQSRPDFGRLQARMHVAAPSAELLRSRPVLFYVFDLLYLDGPLIGRPYLERRGLLEQLALADGPVRTPPAAVDLGGAAVLEVAREHGLEGVVAKRIESRYEPGRRVRTWIKTALRYTQEVVVCGWNEGEGRRAGTFGALLLGVYDETGSELRFAGMVGTGFTDRTLHELLALLRAREQPTSPFRDPVPRAYAPRPHWIRPDLVGEVEHRQWSADGRLRHPSWRGLRPDRDPRDTRQT